jgi:hypothetical protein
MLFPTTIQTM